MMAENYHLDEAAAELLEMIFHRGDAEDPEPGPPQTM